MISYKWRGSLAFQCNCFLHSTDSPQVEKSRNVRCQLECQDSCKMELLQNIILQKKTLFFKNKYPEPALRLVWKNQKGFLIQTKFGGSARQFWGEGSPKSVLVFLHHAVLSVSIKCLPEMVVVHLLSGHLFDFSPLCVFQMCPQIACHWGCKVALVAFVWLFPMCVF